MEIIVRPANEGDIDWLLTQLRAFDKFATFKRSLFGQEANARAGIIGLVRQHVVLIAVQRHDGGDLGAGIRLGFIAGYQTSHPFNPDIRVLSECFWWVPQEFRRTRAGLLLLNEFDNVGRKRCDWIVFSLEHHSPVGEKHLLRRGYAMKEKSYLLEV